MNEMVTKADRIEQRIDKAVTGGLSVTSQDGGLSFQNLPEVLEFAKVMALADIGIRKHLRGNVGACAAVCMQAIEWRMSPFAVANKSYGVNDQIAYEASLLHAVILMRAPIKGRPKFVYLGDLGPTRRLLVRAELRDEPGEWVEYESPLFKDIKPKNSPLWVNDPDQQLGYFSVRAWCRRHFPDVILGVYADDELPQNVHVGPDKAKDVTPSRNLNDRLDKLASLGKPAERARQEPDHDPETGEITEADETEVANDDSQTETAESSAEEGDAETNDGDLPDEEALLDKGRAAAMRGAAELLRWRKGLSDNERAEIEPHLKMLSAAAKAADGVAA